MDKVRALWSRGGFVLKREMASGGGGACVCPSIFALLGWLLVPRQRGGGVGELLPRLQRSRILRRPLRLRLSRRELAGGHVVGVGDV